MITLKTLHQATEQEVFDQVARHLLTQKEKSLSSDGEDCMYRGNNGLMCAAGCLIANDEYDEKFENNSWNYLTSIYGVTKDHSALICSLQEIHDCSHAVKWLTELDKLAERKNLNTSVLDEFK